MKKCLLLIVVSVFFMAQAFAAGDKPDTLSYALGYQMGKGFNKINLTVNTNDLVKGLQAGQSDAKPAITEDAMQKALKAFQMKTIKKMQAERAKLAKKNLKTSNDFLAKNKKATGVIALADGLQYKIIKKGVGAKPNANDIVTVNYEGSLIDGTVFDSSYKRGTPAQFKVGQVIKGWSEALQLMPVGSTWELYVPAKLAYGANGAGTQIGPNETLVFKVELIKIN
jgi:FKBP-type peptidyl-prolyl cis-trans isomerase FklB